MNEVVSQGAPMQWPAQHGRLGMHLPGAGDVAVMALREQALSALEQSGFPSTRDERWRYTDIRSILKSPFQHALDTNIQNEQARLAALSLVDDIPGLETTRIVIANGEFDTAMPALPNGVTVQSIATALDQDPSGVAALLDQQSGDASHGFLHANRAFLGQGVIVRIAPGCVLTSPLELVYTNAGDTALAIQPRTLVVAGANAQAVLLERYLGNDAGHLTNCVTEVTVNDGAHVEHLRLQQDGMRNFHIGGLFVGVHRDAHYVSHNVNLGARLARVEVTMRLLAPGATGVLNGLYVGSAKQHLDNYTHIEHCKPHGTSRENYKGVLDERARGVFHGRIRVFEGAQKTDAEQSNRNILLSQYAQADSKPQLEIYADDVKCAHGATIGQLDDTALFYLRSRGIDQTTARNLLVFAFADEVVEAISDEAIRAYAQAMLASRLPGGDAWSAGEIDIGDT